MEATDFRRNCDARRESPRKRRVCSYALAMPSDGGDNAGRKPMAAMGGIDLGNLDLQRNYSSAGRN